jgi:hypothetical protein
MIPPAIKNRFAGREEMPPNARRASRGTELSAFVTSAAVHGILIVLLSVILLNSDSSVESVIAASFAEEHAAEADLDAIPEPQLLEIDASPPRKTLATLPNSADGLPTTTDVPDAFLKLASAPQASAGSVDGRKDESDVVEAASVIQGLVTEAGGRTGEVQFALAWKNVNDLDLHVIVPSGEQISYSHKRSRCRGFLDVDMNVDGESTEPVENVRWLKGQAPAGRYTVVINLFQVHVRRRARDPSETAWQLLSVLGKQTDVVDDSVRFGDRLAVYRFQYVPGNWSFPRRQRALAELTQIQQSEEKQAQPMLASAKSKSDGVTRTRLLNEIVRRFPHTDAAIEALQLLPGETTK